MPFSPSPSLLVTSDALEENLFDKSTGLPLAAGIVTFYEDDNRTVLKNIYQQTGTAGAYTYTALPNPMTLNADGSTADNSGNNVKIFYYPFQEGVMPLTQEAYYVTVYNSAGTLQFTRSNFPFEAPATPTPATVATLDNYVINNRFWRNVQPNADPTTGSVNVSNPSTIKTSPSGTITINGVTNYFTTIAPSQHDGFTMPDIIFGKNTTDATDAISFGLFAQAGTTPVLSFDVTPEFYLRFQCTATGTDTFKYIQIPLSLHLSSLGSQPQCSVTIQGKLNSGSGNITMQIFPFAGTGVTSPASTTVQSINLSNSWQKYQSPVFTMPPSIAQASLGAGGDDAFYLRIGLPSGGTGTCDIEIALPSYFLSSEVPTNDFRSYDQINSIISTARTGDVRISNNSFYYMGWVPCNNGTIGGISSSATTRAARDTWQLFNLLWNLGIAYDSGSNSNPIAQMFTSAGSATNYGASAYADFTANNRLGLTSALGQVFAGTVPINALLAPYSTTITASNGGGNLLLTVSSASGLYDGMPVAFITTGSLPGNIVANHVYYITNVTSTTFNVSTTFANMLSNTLVAWSSAGSNSSMIATIGGAITGEAQHTQLVAELAAHTHGALSPNTAFLESQPGGGSSLSTGGGASTFNFPSTTGSTGSSTPFNVMQQTTFINVFIKL